MVLLSGEFLLLHFTSFIALTIRSHVRSLADDMMICVHSLHSWHHANAKQWEAKWLLLTTSQCGALASWLGQEDGKNRGGHGEAKVESECKSNRVVPICTSILLYHVSNYLLGYFRIPTWCMNIFHIKEYVFIVVCTNISYDENWCSFFIEGN